MMRSITASDSGSTAVDAEELVELIAGSGTIVQDPDEAPDVGSPDPDDDYLIALAAKSRSVLVSGDSDLQDLSDHIPSAPPQSCSPCSSLQTPIPPSSRARRLTRACKAPGQRIPPAD